MANSRLELTQRPLGNGGVDLLSSSAAPRGAKPGPLPNLAAAGSRPPHPATADRQIGVEFDEEYVETLQVPASIRADADRGGELQSSLDAGFGRAQVDTVSPAKPLSSSVPTVRHGKQTLLTHRTPF
jgi:hypothetical protein